jgi:hypothetical protein
MVMAEAGTDRGGSVLVTMPSDLFKRQVCATFQVAHVERRRPIRASTARSRWRTANPPETSPARS